MKIDEVPMVRVTWMDARDTENGWVSEKEILAAPLAKCQDVGWIVVNDDERVVIVRSWCHEDNSIDEGGGATAIPKCCVKKIEHLTSGTYEDL